MKKIGFVFSGVLAITGITLLLNTYMINLVMPQIGRVAYQFSSAGSYNPNDYHTDFVYIHMAAIFLIGIGILFGYRCYTTKEK